MTSSSKPCERTVAGTAIALPDPDGASPGVSAPSAFYRAWLWRVGMGAVRCLPAAVLRMICLAVAQIYYRTGRERRTVVVRNLLPVAGGDRAVAGKAAHALFRQFAVKMIDLWRFESGVPVDTWFTAGVDWGILEDASRRGKGVLLITPHLGNWELGGALLAERGYPLIVLTQAEPGRGLTEMRQAARSRRGIETLLELKAHHAKEALCLGISRVRTVVNFTEHSRMLRGDGRAVRAAVPGIHRGGGTGARLRLRVARGDGGAQSRWLRGAGIARVPLRPRGSRQPRGPPRANPGHPPGL